MTFPALTSSEVSSIGFGVVSIATYSSPQSAHANLEIIPHGLLSALLDSQRWLSSAAWISEGLRGFTSDTFRHNPASHYLVCS